jgi:NIPSNAP protein
VVLLIRSSIFETTEILPAGKLYDAHHPISNENQLEDMMEIARVALATVEIAAAKLSGVKMASLLSFISGATVMLGFSNLVGSKQSQHVYELRMYHVNAGKMDALVARFGDHTDAIFKRHNMKSIGYWIPEDTRYSQNLFVYILEHPSSEEARKNWAAFQADPEWQKVKADSEINGALANHIDSYFMDPTSFSGLK